MAFLWVLVEIFLNYFTKYWNKIIYVLLLKIENIGMPICFEKSHPSQLYKKLEK